MTVAEVCSTGSLPVEARVQWPYRPRFARVNGWHMHYVDEGSGDPMLMLHGIPTWGYLWRRTIPPLLAAGHRVIVPDQIGFGLSEKPTIEHAHTLDGHAANLVAQVHQLDLSPAAAAGRSAGCADVESLSAGWDRRRL